MTSKQKAVELISQFGDNAKYVVLEIIDALPSSARYTVKEGQETKDKINNTMIDFWREVKAEIVLEQTAFFFTLTHNEELDVIEFSGPYDGTFYLWSGDIDELIDYLQKAKIELCQKEQFIQ